MKNLHNYVYKPGLGIYVGTFNEADIDARKDLLATTEIMNATGLKYTNTIIKKKNGIPVSMKVYVCTVEDMRI